MHNEFRVDGLHCQGCANTVKAALSQLDTVTSVDVELGDGVPSVVRVSSRDELTAGQVEAALNEEGEFTVLDR